MRPNIDISWSLHGRIKDYADEHDLDLGEAYIALLERSLREEGNKVKKIAKGR